MDNTRSTAARIDQLTLHCKSINREVSPNCAIVKHGVFNMESIQHLLLGPDHSTTSTRESVIRTEYTHTEYINHVHIDSRGAAVPYLASLQWKKSIITADTEVWA